MKGFSYRPLLIGLTCFTGRRRRNWTSANLEKEGNERRDGEGQKVGEKKEWKKERNRERERESEWPRRRWFIRAAIISWEVLGLQAFFSFFLSCLRAASSFSRFAHHARNPIKNSVESQKTQSSQAKT